MRKDYEEISVCLETLTPWLKESHDLFFYKLLWMLIQLISGGNIYHLMYILKMRMLIISQLLIIKSQCIKDILN